MFLDTSGLLCVHDIRDRRHVPAASYYQNVPAMLTTNYVLAEFVALAQVRRVPRENALSFLHDLQGAPRVEVVWVDDQLHKRAMALFDARPNKTYSLCDAVSFALMRERDIREALTTDRHFEQEGFARLLSQE